MRFKGSLSQFQFLSELYAKDAADAVLMTEYPSSNSSETRFQNTTKYIIHDPFPPPPIGLLKTLGPHHLMFGWGGAVPVTSELKPPAELINHWRKIFGDQGCPKWQPIQDSKTYVTSFPFETLDETQQLIDPSALYHLHSKQAIAGIPCAQAKVYDEVRIPCIMKLSHGYAGLGNFFIRSQADLDKAQTQIDKHWPDAPVVINELLTNIIGDYGVQFYLDRSGEMTWLGFTQQVFNDTGRWTGGIFNADIQDEFYDAFLEIAKPVAAYLHRHGYFGVVGIDILQDADDNFYLVDLNPRLTGITPFLITSRLLIKNGLVHGIYAASVELEGDLAMAIALAESTDSARVAILSAYQAPGSRTTKCHIAINGETREACDDVLQALLR